MSTLALPEHSITTLDRVHHMDALALLRALPSGSVDLIATDPPYNMRKASWDVFDSDAALVAWLGVHFAEMRRVLAANGSVYVFCDTRLQADVEIEMRKHFHVLNNIRWRKPAFSTKAEMFDKDTMRRFFPASETIIFAEQYGADTPYNNALVDENSTYWEACETAKRSLIGDYLQQEFDRAKVTRREMAALFPSKTGNLTGCVSNWLLGYNVPTPEQYQKMRDHLNANHRNGGGEYLRREYEDLRHEYEDLRREYEDLRRPFNATPAAPYTDVWDFPTVGAYEGKHPTEKPLAMMKHIVRMSSRPGAVVLDPFCGSGTTLDAARQLGRRFIGGDSDRHWCAYARRRVTLPFARTLFDLDRPEDDAPTGGESDAAGVAQMPLFAAR